MNLQQRLTQKIFQRLLRESQEEREERGRRRMAHAADMAVYVRKTASSVDIVLYDPAALLDWASGPQKHLKDHPAFMDKIIIGVISAGQTENPCNGAWTITQSAVRNQGGGDAGVLYGLAFAASGGALTPDRKSVTPAAQGGWIKQASRGGKPFDDASLPPEERRTPDDPSDDCVIHKKPGCICQAHIDVDALNRSYEAEGWEEGLLHKLRAAHDDTMRKLGRDSIKTLLAMRGNSDRFFSRYYFTY